MKLNKIMLLLLCSALFSAPAFARGGGGGGHGGGGHGGGGFHGGGGGWHGGGGGWHGGGWGRGGWGGWGPGIGFGVGLGLGSAVAYDDPYYYDQPDVVYVQQSDGGYQQGYAAGVHAGQTQTRQYQTGYGSSRINAEQNQYPAEERVDSY